MNILALVYCLISIQFTYAQYHMAQRAAALHGNWGAKPAPSIVRQSPYARSSRRYGSHRGHPAMPAAIPHNNAFKVLPQMPTTPKAKTPRRASARSISTRAQYQLQPPLSRASSGRSMASSLPRQQQQRGVSGKSTAGSVTGHPVAPNPLLNAHRASGQGIDGRQSITPPVPVGQTNAQRSVDDLMNTYTVPGEWFPSAGISSHNGLQSLVEKSNAIRNAPRIGDSRAFPIGDGDNRDAADSDPMEGIMKLGMVSMIGGQLTQMAQTGANVANQVAMSITQGKQQTALIAAQQAQQAQMAQQAQGAGGSGISGGSGLSGGIPRTSAEGAGMGGEGLTGGLPGESAAGYQ